MKTRITMAFLMVAALCIGGARMASAHCAPPGSVLCVGGFPNGVTSGSEQCDDNNNTDCDNCHNDCSLNVVGCGDCHVCDAEVCDDGNTVTTDGCNNACSSNNTCGNGITDDGTGDTVDKGEECDDGDTVSCDGCDSNCTPSACGNNIKCPGEECDDGNTLFGDGCRGPDFGNECKIEKCGNNRIDCKLGGPNPPADDSCSNGVEECDDGNTVNCDGCDSGCKAPDCGNNTVCTAAGELCDDGNTVNGDNCDEDCQTEICGNGITNTGKGEECDWGGNPKCVGGTKNGLSCCEQSAFLACQVGGGDCEANGNPCCSATLSAAAGCVPCNNNFDVNNCRCNCQSAGCGDGVTDDGEQCDDGLRNDGLDDADSCPNGSNAMGLGIDCNVTQICGDGVPQLVDSSGNCTAAADAVGCTGSPANCKPGVEECDSGTGGACVFGGNVSLSKRCLENPVQACTLDSPGCHCGNANTADHCRTDCVKPKCGDDITDTGESCDDGNTTNPVDSDDVTDDCKGNCSPGTCGDGITQAPEVCDDANANNCDNCSAKCLNPACGDNFLCATNTFDTSKTEKCDDGNTLDGDTCNSDCTQNVCGDGITNLTGCTAACTPNATDTGICAGSTEQCDAGKCSDSPTNNCSGSCCLFDPDNSGTPPSPGAANAFNALDCCLEDLKARMVIHNVGGLVKRVQKIIDTKEKKLTTTQVTVFDKKICAGERKVQKKISALAKKIDQTGFPADLQKSLQDNRARCARWANRYGDIQLCPPIL